MMPPFYPTTMPAISRIEFVQPDVPLSPSGMFTLVALFVALVIIAYFICRAVSTVNAHNRH